MGCNLRCRYDFWQRNRGSDSLRSIYIDMALHLYIPSCFRGSEREHNKRNIFIRDCQKEEKIK